MDRTILGNKVAIYIPSTMGKRKHYEPEQEYWTNKAVSLFCKLYGGATVQKVKGSYVGKDGVRIDEDINIVYSYTKATTFHDVEFLAEDIRRDMEQETVLIEHKGKGVLIGA